MQQLSSARAEGDSQRDACISLAVSFCSYVAKATTEMERSGIEVRCAIADGFYQLMWRKPRPRWSEAESRCAAQLRMVSTSLCGESHDRDGAERNRGALRNCGWKELEEGTNTNVQNLKGKMGLFPSGRSGCARRGYSQISFFKNNRHHIVCLSINRQSCVTLMVVSLL